MTHDPNDYAGRMTRYIALAIKFRQRAEFAELTHEFDLADTYARLGAGYEILAQSAGALSHFPTPEAVLTPGREYP